MFEQIFRTELSRYTSDSAIVDRYWKEIQTSYSAKGRHYHTLAHLENLLAEILPVKEKITDWSTLVFAIAYHDIVYKTSKTNNEEMSAKLAYERLSSIAAPAVICEKCAYQVMATKAHKSSPDTDTNYLTDADLAILGASPADYTTYTNQVRKEYGLYPGFIYKPGRKKVLAHFLEMPTIYKTEFFSAKYETAARENLRRELERL